MPDTRINNSPSTNFCQSPQTPSASRSGPPPVFMPELKDQALQTAFPQPITAAGTAPADSLDDPFDDLLSAMEDDESADEDSTDSFYTGDLSSLLLPLAPADDTGTASGAGGAAAPASSAAANRVEGAQTEDASLGLDALAANLSGLGNDNGIFEVSMPNGQQLGVAVSVQPNGVRFLMSPADSGLRDRIKNCRMELEGAVERHINKDVEIAVL